ncbi:hypothetical protein L6452_18063 [Arctium lappa]|uniref:Uncharacterized protein n=1 Tax=Arctium lappa TaxID=4217 RepID=A0ACB9C513_ARCLA|nr:hypothetical protein L6452_18063 [Arctium lappa]
MPLFQHLLNQHQSHALLASMGLILFYWCRCKDPGYVKTTRHDSQNMKDDRFAHEFKALLAVVITTDAGAKEYEDGKTVLSSWSTAKRLLEDDTDKTKCREKTGNRCGDDMWRSCNEGGRRQWIKSYRKSIEILEQLILGNTFQDLGESMIAFLWIAL